MSLTSIFDIAGSGMSAQSVRLNTTASNLDNAQTTKTDTGGVYKARYPVFRTILDDQAKGAFRGAGGVRVAGIVESTAEPVLRFEPGHPERDERGMVAYPNVNVVESMTDMISASRSFQLNVEVMNTTKTMLQRLMSLGQ